MQQHELISRPEEITLFICTNMRVNEENPGCAKTLDYDSFKEIKHICIQKFGPAVKLVATHCQGACPKNAFYTTLIQPKRNNKTKQLVLEDKEELQTIIKEELQELLR